MIFWIKLSIRLLSVGVVGILLLMFLMDYWRQTTQALSGIVAGVLLVWAWGGFD